MCLAVPGRIVKIEEDTATIDYGSEQRSGKLVSEEFSEGDYCIVQGGIVIEKIPQDEAEAALKLYHQATN